MLPTFSFTFFKDFLTNQPRKYLYNALHTVYTAIFKTTTLFWPHGVTWKLHYMPQGRTELVQEIFRFVKAIYSTPSVYDENLSCRIFITLPPWVVVRIHAASMPCRAFVIPHVKKKFQHTFVSLLLQLSVVLSKVWEDWRSWRKYKELFLKK